MLLWRRVSAYLPKEVRPGTFSQSVEEGDEKGIKSLLVSFEWRFVGRGEGGEEEEESVTFGSGIFCFGVAQNEWSRGHVRYVSTTRDFLLTRFMTSNALSRAQISFFTTVECFLNDLPNLRCSELN